MREAEIKTPRDPIEEKIHHRCARTAVCCGREVPAKPTGGSGSANGVNVERRRRGGAATVIVAR